MNSKLKFVFPLIVLTLAGLTFRLWFQPLMSFVGANSDLIQGLTSLLQLVIWIGVGITIWFGLIRPNQNQIPPIQQKTDNKPQHKPEKNEATLEGDGAIAQGTNTTAVGKGGIYIGRNVSGNNIVTGNNNVIDDGKKGKKI